MRIALFQPEIPQNTGTILRLAACMNIPVDIIEPCGFIWNHPSFKRSVMDYIDCVDVVRHPALEDFYAKTHGRIIVCDVGGDTSLYDMTFQRDDVLLFGQESVGLPHDVRTRHTSLHIPMPGNNVNPDCRSLNLAVSVGMVVGAGMAQIL